MPENDKIRVYLLDDHEIVRQGIRTLLEAAGDIEVVGESGSAVDAANRIPALRPDVAVLDGRLPEGSGIRRSSAEPKQPHARSCRRGDPHPEVAVSLELVSAP